MADHDATAGQHGRHTAPEIDLGMVCTCGPEGAHAAAEALRDAVVRHHLNRDLLVSDLITVLQRRFGVRDIRIGLDQWFGIGFRIGTTDPPMGRGCCRRSRAWAHRHDLGRGREDKVSYRAGNEQWETPIPEAPSQGGSSASAATACGGRVGRSGALVG
jgi:hypothetical protein